MSNKILKLNNVSYSYVANIYALKDVSLTINKGEFVSIIGHNGSGKSTLAKIIAGIIDLPKTGEIDVFGERLTANNSDELRSDIGIVFQNPDNQFIGTTVRDDLAFGLENKRVPQAEMDDIIEDYANKVGMEKFLEKEPMHLSGGQKQRVAIAGVLAMQPKILLLDEATAMLDPQGKREIKEIIHELKRELNDLTIISITHDIEETLDSDKIIVLNEGEVALTGTPLEIYQNAELLKQIDLDLPFIFKLKNELATQGITVDGDKLEEIAKQLWP